MTTTPEIIGRLHSAASATYTDEAQAAINAAITHVWALQSDYTLWKTQYEAMAVMHYREMDLRQKLERRIAELEAKDGPSTT
jgi:dihydrodipicolinate synthase/N-acetylneuraminate lyase